MMDALDRISTEVSELTDPLSALVAVTEEATGLFGARLAFALMLGEGVGGRHVIVSDRALRDKAESIFHEQMREPGGWLEALRRLDFSLIDNRVDTAHFSEEWDIPVPPEDMGRLLVVPLAVRGSAVGALAIVRARKARPFNERDRVLAERIANILVSSIGMAVQTEEMDHFFAASLDLLCMIDVAGHLHRMNPQWDQILGYDPQELEGVMFIDLVHPEDRALTSAAFVDLFQAKVPAQFVNRFKASDGSYHSMEWVARPGAELVYASGRDISARLAQERALRESEERYRLIADNVADVIWVLDLKTMRFTYISPSVERFRGFTVDEALAQTVEAAVTPDSYPKVLAALQDGLRRATPGDFPIVTGLEIEQPCKDGRIVSTEIITKLLAAPDGEPAQILGVSRDITARKAAEEALRESRKRLEDLMFVVGDWIWEADAEYRYSQCSDGVRAVLGYEPAEVVGKRPWDLMAPADAEEMRHYARERAARKEGCTEVVNRNLHRDGREVVLLTSCVPILDDSGELVGFRGIDKDITGATQTQESLRRSVVELNALWQIAETVAGPSDLTAVLNSVTRQISEALQARFALVVTFGEGGESRRVVASNAADAARYDELLLELAQLHLPELTKIAGVGEPVVINDMFSGAVPARVARKVGPHGFSRLLMIPLVLQTQIIGALMVTRGADGLPFMERDIEFAQAAAGSVAAAVIHARLQVEENFRTANQVRDHLARELHDAVTQSVYSASLIAQALPTIWQRSPEEGIAGLGQLQRLVRSALAELRILLYELRPGTLAGVGLDQLLDRLGDSLAGQADVSVTIDARIEEPPPGEVKEAMYRIAQEAFNNIAKHARAANVLASLVSDLSGATLRVQDDGVGVDADSVEGDHMGIAIMRERAKEIGAQFRIDRVKPTGTRLTVRWMAPEGVLAGRL